MSNAEKTGDSLNLSSWTLIDSRGEIMPGDGDSESSESSIEVIQFEDGEIATFSSRYGNETSDDSNEESLEHDLLVEESENFNPIHSEIDPSIDCDEKPTETEPIDIGPDTLNDKSESLSTSQADINTSSCVVETVEPEDKKGQDPEKASNGLTDFLLSDESETGNIHEDLLALDKDEHQDEHKDEHVTLGDPSRATSEMNYELGACCLDLLPKICDNSEILTEPVIYPSPMSYEEVDKLLLSEDESTSGSLLIRGDSDTDSDFVPLDGVSLKDMSYDVSRMIIPVSVSRTDSSIGPSFSFLRNAGAQEPDDLDRDSVSPYEEDLDDDTESSTEDGVDDRIESEQSEAGSMSAHNDIGDLSVFADIGDIPLDAGNVPRNYIHSPNNHLSTILNVIVLVAAILTMGISLGIIVGTDLEMEEWQHALDKQSMKVLILEQQLQIKLQEANSLQRKIDTLQDQFKETKVTAKGFEKAFDQLIYEALVKGQNHETGWQELKEAFESFISCDRTLQDSPCMSFEAMFSIMTCDKSIRAFLDSYALIKNESNPDDPTGQKQELNEQVQRAVTTEEHNNSPKKAARSAPVSLDIKVLQQSLTREQQRALRWQHLYLAERRQKERERENEEWEDEREREIWENEKEHLDQVECLKKLMSANVTRLTQHFSQWNLSVFDDFANLSHLLSEVAELKQSVIESIQNVWERAEELFDNVHKKNLDLADQKQLNQDISDQQLLYAHVTQILQEISEWPDKENLLKYLNTKVSTIKPLLEKVILSDPTNQIWINSDTVFKNIKMKFDQAQELGKDLDKKQIVESVALSLYDLKQSLEMEFSEELQRSIKIDRPDEVESDKHNFEGDPNNYRKPSSWHKRLGRIIKNTGASIKVKVKNTWQKIKSMWHGKKTAWHKIKKLWYEKKPSLVKIAKGFTDQVINVSSKFKKLCTSLPKAIFNNNNNNAKVDINSKSVHKARKQWQKDILHDPCAIFGKFSSECNSDKRQLKKSIKKINHEFSDILKLATPGEAHKLKPRQANFIHQKLKSFYDQWGGSKLLLKTDLDWVSCQIGLWLNFINKVGGLDLNSCNNIRLRDNLGETYCGVNKPQGLETQEALNAYDKVKEDKKSHSHLNVLEKDAPNLHNSVEFSGRGHGKNDTLESDSKPVMSQETSSDWYLEWSKYRSQSRMEKGKADWIFEKAADREKQRNDEKAWSHWLLQRAENRKQRRREEHRNDWLFDRMQRHLPCDSKVDSCDLSEKEQYNDWFVKHSNHREKMRRQASESSIGPDVRRKHKHVNSEKMKKPMYHNHEHHSHSRASKHEEKGFHHSSGFF